MLMKDLSSASSGGYYWLTRTMYDQQAGSFTEFN